MKRKTVSKSRVLKSSKRQTGRSNKAVDRSLKAKLPGKRRSSTGKIYYEYRKNRTDVNPKKRL